MRAARATSDDAWPGIARSFPWYRTDRRARPCSTAVDAARDRRCRDGWPLPRDRAVTARPNRRARGSDIMRNVRSVQEESTCEDGNLARKRRRFAEFALTTPFSARVAHSATRMQL